MLILGAVAGWLVFAVGVLVGVSTFIEGTSAADRSTETALSAVFLVVGIAVLTPCLYFVLRKREADPMSSLAASMASVSQYGTVSSISPRTSSGRGRGPVRILLILGGVMGALIVMFGLLAIAIALTDATLAPIDRSTNTVGAVLIIIIGLAVFLPCIFVLLRLGAANPLPTTSFGLAYPGPPGSTFGGVGQQAAKVGADQNLVSSYLEWFNWCRGQVSGSAIAMHSATMAAMAAAAAGNSAGAIQAARQAASRAGGAIASPIGGAPAPSATKVGQLARIGAATLPLLEPGEQVVVSIFGQDRQAQAWAAMFGLIGYLISATQGGAYFLTVTDRRLIALTGTQLGGRPTGIAFAGPLAMISSVKFRKFWGQATLTVVRADGPRMMLRVTKLWTDEALLAQQALAPVAGASQQSQPPNLPSLQGF